MKLRINGETYEIGDSAGRMLLWVLRDELGLTGTRFSCGAGICGACTVHVGGQAVRSCITPISTVEGENILTIEGLADGDVLHPVQQAFIDHQVPQCGLCMSGQIMQAAAFLEANPDVTEADIVEAMSQNYCRCGCYVRIKAAVMQAAEQMAQVNGATPTVETARGRTSS